MSTAIVLVDGEAGSDDDDVDDDEDEDDGSGPWYEDVEEVRESVDEDREGDVVVDGNGCVGSNSSSSKGSWYR
jgi:hypothetical protein